MPAAESTVPEHPIRQRLGRAGGRLRPGFAGFWSWWTHALATWLPLRMRELLGLARERLLLQLEGDTLRLALERGAQVRELGQLPWNPVDDTAVDPLAPLLAQRIAELPRWLVLPASVGLRRTLVLPAAAIERLREVLAFEIDRQTPFAAADVHYDARVTGRRADGQVEAELAVVPRGLLDARLAALGAIAGTVAGVDLAGPDGRTFGLNLLSGLQRQRRVDPWRGWNLALVAVAAIALAAGLWQVLANRTGATDAFERGVAQRAVKARLVSAEKKQLLDLVEGMSFLHSVRAGRPTTVEVLDELARRLPDSTYLEKLSIEDDRILLIGLSNEASSLVRRLEGSPLWRSPALTGALQPDTRSGRDRFTLMAELAISARPEPEEAPRARSNP
ncbi:MAG TPA: PilN domain-containing protein [Luteimonas sp.]|nr:PilN domain-containing protein [Luteimonas sp.]